MNDLLSIRPTGGHVSASHTFPQVFGVAGGGRWTRQHRSRRPPAACTRHPPRRLRRSCRGGRPAAPFWHHPCLLAGDGRNVRRRGEKALWSVFMSRGTMGVQRCAAAMCVILGWLPVCHDSCPQGKDTLGKTLMAYVTVWYAVHSHRSVYHVGVS